MLRHRGVVAVLVLCAVHTVRSFNFAISGGQSVHAAARPRPAHGGFRRWRSGAAVRRLSCSRRAQQQRLAMVLDSKDDAATAQAPPSPQPTACDGSNETPLELGAALELGVNRAMRGDTTVLRQLLADGCKWSGPLASCDSRDKVQTELRNLGTFLGDPRLTVCSTAPAGEGAYLLDWLASATWPLPWAPRLVVAGQTRVQVGGGAQQVITSLEDTWQEGLVAAWLRNLVPGFWDVWHQFCSPIAERYPYKVLRKGRGYEVWQLAPRLVLQPSIVDRTNSRQARMAYVLPDFAFTASINTRGRVPEAYFTSSPVEAEITPFIESKTVTKKDGSLATVQARANRITWSLQVPSAFGLDASQLPNPRGDDLAPLTGDTIEFQRQDRRVIAVAPYNGSVQDKEAGDLRAKLLDQLAKDGAAVATGPDGRPRAGFMSFDGKVGFNKQGRVSIAVWEYRPKLLGTGNMVYVELKE